MGAAASIANQKYFCHSCRSEVEIDPSHQNEHLICPECEGGFVEELTESDNRFRTEHPSLSDEQTRRMANAALILRLLESSLREEWSQIESTQDQTANLKKKVLTKSMLFSLKHTSLSLDAKMEQPCCPVCSEDFIVGEKVLKMPCTHVYHRTCVMPWLETKKTCPICRFELAGGIPDISDLQNMTLKELSVATGKSLRELKDILLKPNPYHHLGE